MRWNMPNLRGPIFFLCRPSKRGWIFIIWLTFFKYWRSSIINTQYARSFTSKYIEITSWKVRAYNFYSRVVKYHKKNERACERLSFMILHSEWTQIVESPFSVVICLSYENWDYGISIDTFVRCTTLICKVSLYHENTVKILSVNWEDNNCPFKPGSHWRHNDLSTYRHKHNDIKKRSIFSLCRYVLMFGSSHWNITTYRSKSLCRYVVMSPVWTRLNGSKKFSEKYTVT